MNIRIIAPLALFIIFMMVWACKHEPEELAGPQPPGPGPDPPITNPCDPDTVYFEKDLLPVLLSTCAQPGCHDAISMEDGVRLTDYNAVMQTAGITPGDPGESDMYEVITETDPDKRMPPPPKDPWPQENIDMVYTWIAQGALDLSCDDTECDTTDLTYTNQINSIIQAYCLGCHNDNNPLGGLSLEGYDKVKSTADDGRLLGVVRHEAGYPGMPLNSPKLSDCKIRQLEIWIDDGTPQ